MKLVKNILSVAIAMIFLVSSSGYVMYKTNCVCTGEEQTSVFVKPDSCEEDFHQHHRHNETDEEVACSAHECHECQDHEKDCGCESPQFFFFKLKDKALDDDAKFVMVQAPVLAVMALDILSDDNTVPESNKTESFYLDPPPVAASSLDFLISIQQLKIPSLA